MDIKEANYLAIQGREVVYSGHEYTIFQVGYQYREGKKTPFLQLLDRNGRSLVQVSPERVERKE